MFDHSLSTADNRRTIVHWFLLAFLSGSVNVGGLLACNRFVTHVTGFATLFGMHVGEGRYDAAIGILSVPAFFLMGVMVAGFLVDRPFRKGDQPHYALVMFLVAACLASASLFGYFGYFGTFGGELHLKRIYFFLALLCTASGLQNAALTTSSGATVRTTHLTGLTTDFGVGLVRVWSLPKSSPEAVEQAKLEWRWAKIRLGTFLSFSAGAAVGALVYAQVRYLGFLLPAGLALYAMGVALISHRRQLFVSAH